MKHNYLSAGFLVALTTTANAQIAQQQLDTNVHRRVGINTTKPQATLDIRERLNDPNDKRIQGLSLPNFTTDQRNSFGNGLTQSMKVGTLIYNTTEQCIEIYKGFYNFRHNWECMGVESATVAPQQRFIIQPIGFEGNYIGGSSLFSNVNKVSFRLTNNGTTPLTNADLSNAVHLQNTGGNVSVVPNQNTSVSIGIGQSATLTYRLEGTPAQGIINAIMNYTGTMAIATHQVNDAINPLANVSVTFSGFGGTPYIAGTPLQNQSNTGLNTSTVSFTLRNNSNQAVDLPNLDNAISISNANANITAQAISSVTVLNPNQEVNLSYELSGTPVAGQLTATFTAPWGASDSGSTTVMSDNVSIPNGVTLGGSSHYIASVKDNEYIPFNLPTQPAAWVSGQTNGNDPMINIPGIITTQGIEVKIPISVTGSGGTVGAYRQEVTVTAEKSNNNQAGTLVLEWDSQQVTTNNQFIIAKLKAKNTNFHIKQLDMERGLGNDYKGLVLANFTYNANSANTTVENFTVKAISGIPDKKFGVKTNNKFEHDFIYLPMQGPDGKTWLNNNLGAEYANITSPYFNPTRQAGALDYTNTTINAPALANPTADQIKKDWRAYGYLFEWGRDSDGHEVIKWTSETQGTFANQNMHNYTDNYPDYNKANDPCPVGFHTPSYIELQALQDAIVGYRIRVNEQVGQTPKLWQESGLRLPAAGGRNLEGVTLNQGKSGIYWSSSQNRQGTYHHYFSPTYSSLSDLNYFPLGHSVRCLQD